MGTRTKIKASVALQVAQWVKESTCNTRDVGSIPGLGRYPGGGHGNPLQYSLTWRIP